MNLLTQLQSRISNIDLKFLLCWYAGLGSITFEVEFVCLI